MRANLAISKGFGTFRRFISVTCAVAFLFVSLVHASQHSSVDHFASAGMELSDSIDSSAGDQSHDNIGHGSGHCHGCVMVAIVDLGSMDIVTPAQTFINFVPPAFAAVTLSKDVPYPIATI